MTTHYLTAEGAPRLCGDANASDSATTDPNDVACPDCLDRINGYDGHTPALVHWGTWRESTRTTANGFPYTSWEAPCGAGVGTITLNAFKANCPRCLTATQGVLFPEPEHTEKQPAEHRWHVLDDQDGPAFATTHAALVLGGYHTLDAVRADHDDDEWLFDALTDQLYAPYDWPDTDEPQAVSLHLRALTEAAR